MVDQGLLSCQSSLAEAPCIVKLLECIVSIAMVLFILYDMVRRLSKQLRFSMYVIIELAMILTLVSIIAYSLDSDIIVFNFLSAYFYDVYFSIIVLKLGLKLLQIMKFTINYSRLRITAFILFSIFQALLLIALIYVSVQGTQQCFNLPFLIANSVFLLASIVFAVLGVKHTKHQQAKLDQSLAQRIKSNPLPRFKWWIGLNCFGQLIVLIQSVVFQINNCQFSSNVTTDVVSRLLFVFFGYHLGMASTIYFFNLTTRPFQQQKQDLAQLRQTSPSIQPREKVIQMVYNDFQQIRDKADSQ